MGIGAEVGDGVAMVAESSAKASEESGAAAAAASSSARQRKKRKWDQPAESLLQAGLTLPNSLPFDAGSLSGSGVASHSHSVFVSTVAAVSSTITNATSVIQKTNQSKIQDELIAREIVINDADTSVRSKLTKRQMQEEIQRSTGAVVITRGKYRPPNALPDNEKPLYLHISAGAHLKDTAERIKAVDRAASMVEEILKQGHSPSIFSTSYSSLNTGAQVLQPLTRCLFLGFDPDPSVNIAARIRGPNDQYINHIMNETGASVMLMGKGSGNIGIPTAGEREQPLYLYISSSNQKSLEDARILTENLLDTISLELGVSRAPPTSKVYKAVPPPQQLLDGVESSVSICSSVDVSTGKSSLSSSLHVSPVSPAYLTGSSLRYGGYGSQSTDASFCSPSSISTYSGYEGIYPKATALQQVALALSGAPISATLISTAGYAGTSLKMNASSGAESDKRTQRRKFQELPVASNGPITFDKNSGQELGSLQNDVPSGGLSVRSGSSSSPPESNGVLPHQLPPIPKFSQPSLTRGEKFPEVLTKGPIPDPLMKLMEYGDEDGDGDGEPTFD